MNFKDLSLQQKEETLNGLLVLLEAKDEKHLNLTTLNSKYHSYSIEGIISAPPVNKCEIFIKLDKDDVLLKSRREIINYVHYNMTTESLLSVIQGKECQAEEMIRYALKGKLVIVRYPLKFTSLEDGEINKIISEYQNTFSLLN